MHLYTHMYTQMMQDDIKNRHKMSLVLLHRLKSLCPRRLISWPKKLLAATCLIEGSRRKHSRHAHKNVSHTRRPAVMGLSFESIGSACPSEHCLNASLTTEANTYPHAVNSAPPSRRRKQYVPLTVDTAGVKNVLVDK